MKKLFYLLVLLLPFVVKAEATLSSSGQLCTTYSGSGNPGLIEVKVYDMDNLYNFNGLFLGGKIVTYTSNKCWDVTNDFVVNTDYSFDGTRNYRYEVSYYESNDPNNKGDALVTYNKITRVVDGVFTELQPHTVRFHLNGGSWTTEDLPSNYVKPADEITIYEVQRLNIGNYNFIPLKDNYVFKGWYLNEDFSGVDEVTLSNVTNDIDLYAKWVTSDTKYTVRFEDENGNLISEQKVQVDGFIEDNIEIPVKDGYKFVNWCVVYEGNCGEVNLKYYQVQNDVTIRPVFKENSKVISDVDIYIRAPRIGDVYTVDLIPQVGAIQNPKVYVQSLTDHVDIDWVEFYSNNNRELFQGTVLEDTDYEYGLSFIIPRDLISNYTLANIKVLNVIVNGKKIDIADLDCYNPYMYNPTSEQDLKGNYACSLYTRIPSTDEKYAIMHGQNQNIDKDSDLVIRIDGDVNDFKELVVDGKVVDSKFYKLEVGSTIVTLDKSYLSSLEDGDHEIKVVYNDGDISTSFNINPDVPLIDALANEVDSSNPFTADTIIISFIVLSISLLGFGYFFKKKYAMDKVRKEWAL